MPGVSAAAGEGGAFDAGSGGHDDVRRGAKLLRTERHRRTQGQPTSRQGQSSHTTSVHRRTSFHDRPVGSAEFAYQEMLRTNRSYDGVLIPGYLTKSYQLASAVTRVEEKPLTCSETHCERRMSK
jgi:hypothetical protein